MNSLDLWAFRLLCDFNPYHGPDGRFTSGGKRVKMSKSEVRRVRSRILTDHPGLKPGEKSDYFFGSYYYKFTVKGPGDYRFTMRLSIAGNEAYIDELRGEDRA